MARCGCSGTTCSCVIRGTGTTQVTGAGTISAPYVIDSRLYLVAGQQGAANVQITGTGGPQDPYTLDVSQDIYLNDVQDVAATGGSTGDVLAKQADGTFALVPPTTAPVGAVSTDSTLTGDGSSGDPLGISVQAGGGLTSTPTGLAVSGFTGWSEYTPQISTKHGHIITLDTGSSIVGRYIQIGSLVFISITLNASLNIPTATGYYSFSLPVPDGHTGIQPGYLNAFMHDGPYQRNHRQGLASVMGTNRVERIRLDNGTYARNVDNNWPKWGEYAHRITVHGFYEAA